MTLYEMLSARAVAANAERHEITIAFDPKPGDPELIVSLPAGAVGVFVAQIAAAHQELALKSDEFAGAFLPLRLSGARPFKAPDGSPILMLQFEGVFEVAVSLTKTQADALSTVAERFHEPSASQPPKRH